MGPGPAGFGVFCGSSFLKQELQNISACGLEEPGEGRFVFSKGCGTLLVERLCYSEMQALLTSSVSRQGGRTLRFSCFAALPAPSPAVSQFISRDRRKGAGGKVKCKTHQADYCSAPATEIRWRNLEERL